MKLICSLLFSFSLSLYGQKKIQLVNSVNQPIQYAAIYKGSDYTYSNEEGYFIINTSKNDSISIKAVGFEPLRIASYDVQDKIVLNESIMQLNEVIVQKKKLIKSSSEKAINTNEFLDGFSIKTGGEVAVLIENRNDYTVILQKIVIPIYTKSIYTIINKPQVLKKIPFNTFLKVNFYKNNNSSPGLKINEEEIVILINEKADNYFEIDLKKNKIIVPKGGLFVSIENLGNKSDSTKLFALNSVNKGTLLMPLFIISDKYYQPITFIRSNFDKINNWKNISDPDINLSPNSKNKKIENIGIGYTLEMYE